MALYSYGPFFRLMALYTKSLPLDIVTRLWDCYLFEGEVRYIVMAPYSYGLHSYGLWGCYLFEGEARPRALAYNVLA